MAVRCEEVEVIELCLEEWNLYANVIASVKYGMSAIFLYELVRGLLLLSTTTDGIYY